MYEFHDPSIQRKIREPSSTLRIYGSVQWSVDSKILYRESANRMFFVLFFLIRDLMTYNGYTSEAIIRLFNLNIIYCRTIPWRDCTFVYMQYDLCVITCRFVLYTIFVEAFHVVSRHGTFVAIPRRKWNRVSCDSVSVWTSSIRIVN